MKLDTANFIRTIQEHMDENAETTAYNPKTVSKNEPSGLQLQPQASQGSLSIPDIGDEANRSLEGSPLKGAPDKRLTLLPEINGPVKSIKQLLL